MSKICTLNNNTILTYTDFNSNNFILINENIPAECTFLVKNEIKLQYSQIWDITWNIKSGAYNGESYNMPYNAINIGFDARSLDFEIKSGELIYSTCTNCHIIDYVNGQSIPLSEHYIYLCGEQRPVPPDPTVTYANFCEPQPRPIHNNNYKTLCEIIYSRNALYTGFFPYDDVDTAVPNIWVAIVKYRFYFNKPISQLTFRNSIDAFFNEKSDVGNNINLTPNANIDFKDGEWKNIGQYWNQYVQDTDKVINYFPNAQILVTYQTVSENN